MFVSVSEVFEAKESGADSNLWITSSYDATSHFESSSEEILQIYEKIVGEKLDLNIEPNEEDEDYWRNKARDESKIHFVKSNKIKH